MYDLITAYRSARRPRGTTRIVPAQQAIANARANMALMQEAESRRDQARQQLADARAIDPRRYAPAMEDAREAESRARREWNRAWRLLHSGRSVRGDAMRAGHDADMPGSVYVENPESYGLRLVGRVMADTPRGEIWDRNDSSGWYDNAQGESYGDGTGLVYGLVYQMPARDGCPRFVAAYQNGDNDSGALIDFGNIYQGERDSNCSYEGARGNDAARDAAYAADSMAKCVAEDAREYDSAWQAGSTWAEYRDQAIVARQEALAILKERRAIKGQTGFPALCDAIRDRVSDLLSDMSDARSTMARLVAGEGMNDSDYERGFYPGEERLRAAFCEGADIAEFPA